MCFIGESLPAAGGLRQHNYEPGRYHSFYIDEPKRRLIRVAPICELVVHHALCNLIEPLFECSIIADSYANGQINLDHLSSSMKGWANHARFGNTISLRKAVWSQRVFPPLSER